MSKSTGAWRLSQRERASVRRTDPAPAKRRRARAANAAGAAEVRVGLFVDTKTGANGCAGAVPDPARVPRAWAAIAARSTIVRVGLLVHAAGVAHSVAARASACSALATSPGWADGRAPSTMVRVRLLVRAQPVARRLSSRALRASPVLVALPSGTRRQSVHEVPEERDDAPALVVCRRRKRPWPALRTPRSPEVRTS